METERRGREADAFRVFARPGSARADSGLRSYSTKSMWIGCGNAPMLGAATQQLGHGAATLVAVVSGEVVDVHRDEAVGDGGVDAPTELQRVLERFGAVVEPRLNRLAEHVGQLAEPLHVASHDVHAERQRAARSRAATTRRGRAP